VLALILFFMARRSIQYFIMSLMVMGGLGWFLYSKVSNE